MTKILITSPSLNTDENVSGISSLVTTIMEKTIQPMDHFVLGSKDGEIKNMKWVLKQIKQYFYFRKILKSQDYGIIHINTSLVPLSVYRDFLYSYGAKKIYRKKVILHIHGGKFLMTNPNNRRLKKLIKAFLSHADELIVLSFFEKKALKELYGIQNALIFPNAVDTSHTTKATQRSYQKDTFLKFIFLGSINKAKGIHIITKALALLKPYFDRFSFDIYGAGPDLEKWLSDLNQLEGLNYKYKGVAKGIQKWDALRKADVFLLPSYGEGLPIAMLEAMAVGCAVVVTDDASMTTVIQHNKNGIVIPKDDPEKLAKELIGMIHSSKNIEYLSKNSMEYIENHLSFSTYIKKLDILYLNLGN